MEILKTICDNCRWENECNEKEKYNKMVNYMVDKAKVFEETEGKISQQLSLHCRSHSYEENRYEHENYYY